MGGIIETRPAAFRFELRDATRSEHQVLDAHPAFAAFAEGRLGIAGYRRLMRLFHGLYAGLDVLLESAGREFLPDQTRYSYAPRTPYLAGDLADLGVDPLRPVAGIQRCDSLPDLCGALYVVEGSLLGGTVLQRSAATLLSANNARGDAYWRWCGIAAGSRWGATCALIESSSTSAHSRHTMIDAARATFGHFSRWFGQWRD